MASDTFSFDMQDPNQAQDGPRFNVYYTLPNGTSGYSAVGGSANAAKSPAPEPNWRHYTLSVSNPAHAYPPIPAGSIIELVVFLVDNPGKYVIDNIGFRDQVAGKPGSTN